MALREIRIWPDKSVCTPTQKVAHITEATRTLVADMFETMYAEEGIGLAANQVGEPLAVVVMDLDPHKEAATDPDWRRELRSWGFTGPLTLINPRITRRAGTIEWDEACLSVPGVTATVSRSAQVEVAYEDATGRSCLLRAKDLFAVCIQHELDHLAGKVFVEYLPAPKQAAIKRKMQRTLLQQAS
jgi:peptide deformylase